MSLAGKTISIGVLMLPYFHWLDAAITVDFLNNHSKRMVQLIGMPQVMIDKATEIQWHYISKDLNPVQATSGPLQIPTCTYTTAPHLDYILIPGADPTSPLPEGCTEFLKTRFDQLRGLLTVCTSSMTISSTGLLDGLQVCSSKMALSMAAAGNRVNKNIKWVGDRRWVVDGKVWSSAGWTAGIDVAAAFARAHFDPDIVEFVKTLTEYTPKPSQPDEWSKILTGVDLQ